MMARYHSGCPDRLRAPVAASASHIGWLLIGVLCLCFVFVGSYADRVDAAQSPVALSPSEATKKVEDLDKRIKTAEQDESEQTALQMGLQLGDLNERTGSCGRSGPPTSAC